MADAPAKSKLSRPWHQCRLLRYLTVLVAGCVVAHLVWDVLFMPADLRRLQGSWKVVRVVQDDEMSDEGGDRIVIIGRRLTVATRNRDHHESYAIDIIPAQHELLFCQEQAMTLFGMTIRLPVWFKRGETHGMRYELDGSNLTLRLRLDWAPERIERRLELVRED